MNGKGVFPSTTVRVSAPEGTVYVRVGFTPDGPRHVYAHVGKGGYPLQAAADGLSRLISKLLHYGACVEEVCEVLDGIRHERSSELYEAASLAEAIAKGLRKAVGGERPGEKSAQGVVEEAERGTTESARSKGARERFESLCEGRVVEEVDRRREREIV